MRVHHVQIIFLTVLVVLCLGMNWIASTRPPLPAKETNHYSETLPEISSASSQSSGDREKCPPCELFFRKLERSGQNGKMIQDVKVQQRGEPKSGTSFMYDWATGTLVRTCDYLKQLFGEGSCRIKFLQKDEIAEHQGRVGNRIMTFEPAMGGDDARCSCETVERVSIEISDYDKHMLPVNVGCAYSHGKGIDFGPIRDGEHFDKDACRPTEGKPIKCQDDLWECMHEAKCEFTDEWQQMSVFRDPRPAVVSSYFHLKRLSSPALPTLEEFVAKKLPIMCQWLAVRYTLFSGSLSHQSTEFWYRKALANPLGWHHTWFDMVGLQLPFSVVNATANGAVAYDFRFNKKHIDAHPGEEGQADAGVRKFEDQVSPEVLHLADEVLRVWLPPVLLEQLGVAPVVASRQVGLDAPVRVVPPPPPPPILSQQMK